MFCVLHLVDREPDEQWNDIREIDNDACSTVTRLSVYHVTYWQQLAAFVIGETIPNKGLLAQHSIIFGDDNN